MFVTKKILIGLLALVFPLVSCSSSDDNDGPVPDSGTALSVDPTSINAQATGSTFTITVNAQRGEWTAYTDASWITLDNKNTNQSAGTITANIAANTSDARQATINVRSGSTRQTISVTQEAKPTVIDNDTSIVVPDGYTLDWHDEFDYTGKLSSDWTEEAQPAGWVNHELQTYIKGTSVNEVKDGALNIHCYRGNDGKIYSGRVYAKVNTGWKYGYFEARIKLPKGKGTWPAFWMMPVGNNYNTNPWPGCGEIDIMEEVGVDANYVTSTIHCNKYNNGNTSIEHCSNFLATAESDYHIYGCEWTPEYIRFYVDRKPVLTYNNDHQGKDSWPYDYAFYPILNLAWGGDWGGYKGVDNNALPVTMNVDYVRVFVKK